VTGGECGFFDLVNDAIENFKNDRDLLEVIVPQLVSQQTLAIKPEETQLKERTVLETALLKICTRLAKIGKDLKFIFETLDDDKSGSCKSISH